MLEEDRQTTDIDEVGIVMKAEGMRSRWVARDFKPKGDKDREDLFAAMPPLEAKRMLFRQARVRRRKKYKLLFIDVRKAHLNGAGGCLRGAPGRS